MASTNGESEISDIEIFPEREVCQKRRRAMSTKSQVVSWMGVSMSLIQGLVKEVHKLGGTDEDIRKLVTPEGESLLTQIAELIVRVVHPIYKVVVDYTKTLAEMVSAGKYNWVNPDITQENFPVAGQGKQEREIVLFDFDRVIGSDDAIKEMVAAGYRPAVLEELLALGEAQPELQRQFPIVALGSVWRRPDGSRDVPYLCSDAVERHLRLGGFELDWREDDRFAAVRNAS